MTEYDYSPEAFEKYLATQSRIARWVDKTNQHQPRNPFTAATPTVPDVPLPGDDYRSRAHGPPPSTQTRHRSASHSASTTRPSHSRHHTSPGPRDDYHSSSTSRHSSHHDRDRDRHHHHRSSSRHDRDRGYRSSPTSPVTSPTRSHPAYVIPQPQSQPQYSPRHQPVRSQTSPGVVYPHPKNPIVIPYGAGGYVVVPPGGSGSRRKVEMSPVRLLNVLFLL